MAPIEVELKLGEASPALRALLKQLILEVLVEIKGENLDHSDHQGAGSGSGHHGSEHTH
jgi:hypothetical protein